MAHVYNIYEATERVASEAALILGRCESDVDGKAIAVLDCTVETLRYIVKAPTLPTADTRELVFAVLTSAIHNIWNDEVRDRLRTIRTNFWSVSDDSVKRWVRERITAQDVW